MTAGARVFGGVAVWGIVATERCTAFLTNAQMHPGRADLHALLTLAADSRLDCRDLGKVDAGSVRHRLHYSTFELPVDLSSPTNEDREWRIEDGFAETRLVKPVEFAAFRFSSRPAELW
jgi:hypothetical protein